MIEVKIIKSEDLSTLATELMTERNAGFDIKSPLVSIDGNFVLILEKVG